MKRVIIAALLCSMALGSSLGQGRTDYFNVESPQVHPIELASVADRTVVLVCNTPDNSVEIYDTDETLPAAERFIARVPVGLEPVSVRFDAARSRFYTANFLGDSVTVVRLQPGGGGAAVVPTVEQTTRVGDEPLDIAFYDLDQAPDDTIRTVFVTFMNPDGFGWFDARDLGPVGPGLELIEAAVDLPFDSDGHGEDDDSIRLALKQPRTLVVRDDGQLVIVGTMMRGAEYDFAANCRDPLTLQTGDLSGSVQIGGLGNSHFNMVQAGNGDVFIVGGNARHNLENENGVAEAESGFVESTIWMVRDICSDTRQIKSRDVNLESQVQISTIDRPLANAPATVPTHTPVVFGPSQSIDLIVDTPVVKRRALAQPTDVVAFEQGGEVVKLFFTAFGTDKLGIIEPDFDLDPMSWPIRRRHIRALQHSKAGPRGIALKSSDSGLPGVAGPRVYVHNRLDNSVSIFDALSEQFIESFTLQHDPTPGYIRTGQRFLYDAKLSGSGFVSCASCHLDGRTDGLPWDLGTPDATGVPIPDVLLDGAAMQTFATWPEDKNDMVTQSLQGLLNYEVDRETMDLVTNGPYHWRADREDFTSFNAAFKDLLLGTELETAEMEAFEEFVNSMHYGPNPKQRRNRRYSGEFGDPDADVVSDPTSTGALRGMRIFHEVNSLPPRSCVECHSLPSGSNSRLTVPGFQPTESAQLRGLFQREAKRDENGFSLTPDSSYTGLQGMTHDGVEIIGGQSTIQLFNLVASINSFINIIFEPTVCPNQGAFCPDGQTLAQFVHELDWGAGPLIGLTMTIDPRNVDAALPDVVVRCDPDATDPAGVLLCMEEQANEAGSGVAALGSLSGLLRGFWYDALLGLYREEPGGPDLTRTALLHLITADDDYLTFSATPLGSERRIASPTGQPLQEPQGTPPTGVDLLSMVPNTANVQIPLMDGNWVDFNQQAGQSIFMHTLRLYQQGLILDAASENGFGLGSVRHDAPRRFRVAGQNIRPGAELHLFTPEEFPLPEEVEPIEDVELDLVATRRLVFRLYPTSLVTDQGLPVWETAVELDPLHYYQLMLGGPHAQNVTEVFNDTTFQFPDPPDPGTFAPLESNWHFVRVVNADGTEGDAGWKRIRIE